MVRRQLNGPEPFFGSSFAARLPLTLFVLALVLTTIVQLKNADAVYTYRHGSISAVFALVAKNFARFGVVRLGGVPVDNNPPISADDFYIHWPPAFPAALSIWFRLFGVSELVAHVWMLGIEISTALCVFAIARRWLGGNGGALAGLFWLSMPVVVHYGHIVVPESLAILLMLVSVFGFLRAQPWLVAWAAFFAACTSWEAWLLPLGFWIAAIETRRRDYQKIAMASTLAVVAASALIWGVYTSHSPALVHDAIQAGLFRMGLSHTYSQRLIGDSTQRYLSLDDSISRIAVNFPRMLGTLGAGALVLMAISRPRGSAVLLWSLGTPWLLWCTLMRNHMAAHDIEMQLAAPLGAVALAWVVLGLFTRREASVKTWMAGCAISLVIAIEPWAFGTEKNPEDPQQIMGFAATVRRFTDPNAVILAPLVSPTPLYYSDRHFARYIVDERMRDRLVPHLRMEYPQSRLFWATPLYREPWAVITQIR
jgi:Dolichyl-phosphate-mannose-protein mannosyltransferase